ncbi:MAG: polya polymerase, partial [Geobacter sp.]|nr:polya polymerase [Geobacter sp.]
MQVITTHLNADFDCLGAMLAAKMLYPDAQLVFSGSQEKGVRRFFQANPELAPLFTRLKDLDLHAISQLIIVDCQHASRIGVFAEILARVEVHIYDHHPDVSDRIKSSGGLVHACGATSSLLQPLIEAQGGVPSPLHATAMLLGIYEDTGNLTYPVTTAADFIAAAWLFSHGAHLSAVSEFLTRELGAVQVSLLNDLLHSLRRITAGGLDVGIATASLEYYLSDVASLAQMICDIEGIDAVFMVVGMGSRVYLIGRGRTASLDVGEILRHFGGGGHATAGSATVKEHTVIQIASRLEELLLNRVNPLTAVSAIMTAPVKTVTA